MQTTILNNRIENVTLRCSHFPEITVFVVIYVLLTDAPCIIYYRCTIRAG